MEPARFARRFEEWTAALPGDVDTMWQLLNSDAVAQQGRRFVAGALSYLLTQLDLIPDHEKAGSVDDALVLRVCAGLLAEHAAKVDVGLSAQIARLTNEEDEVRAFLGDAAFTKLRRYVIDLADKEVRGRTVDKILADERARADLKRELDVQVKRLKALKLDSDDEGSAIEASVKSYFKMKLGA
jgi:hypothetical protein